MYLWQLSSLDVKFLVDIRAALSTEAHIEPQLCVCVCVCVFLKVPVLRLVLRDTKQAGETTVLGVPLC